MSPENAKNILCLVTSILVLALLILHIARYRKKPKWLRMFYVWIGVLAVLGGAWAFLFPLAITADFGKDGDGAALRQMLIYTTGGVLGVITLGENHRKNTLEKTKNDRDHTRQVHAEIRQVHAERRSRYTTAVEQLSSDKASIRLGGVYTLVGLVDEWLADEKTIPNIEERRKEGQVIINNLCAYIRSPLPLAERAEQLDKDYAKDLQNDFDGDIEKFDADKRAFARDKAALEEERQVRQSIIEEIHKRLQYIGTPGSWSKLDYDFSNAHFFYPIVFTNSCFDASSRFFGATFTQDADFSGTTFTEGAPFSGAAFLQDANFSRAAFTRDADFSMAEFTGNANFSWAKFTRDANFSWAEFTGNANFSKAEFTNANFSKTKFTRDADFSKTKFTGDAHFPKAKFTRDADFFEAKFTRDANFSMAEFTKKANFSWTKFTDAHFFEAEFTGSAGFSEAEFTGSAGFSGATFEEKPIFKSTLGGEARFSYKADPDFKVSHNSRYKIETEEKEYNGAKFIIPKGTELFDPDEPSEQGNNDGN